jgi:serine/threonine protein kinase
MAASQRAQVQLDKVCSPSGRAAFSLRVPECPKEYVFGKSSRGKKVLIPSWVELGGVRYRKLAQFPNTQSVLSAHSGAHGCVAAYEVCGSGEGAAQPHRLALKCVPYGPKKKLEASPWASEWRIHDFLRSRLPGGDASGGSPATSPYVICLGGVSATVGRTCQVYFALELMDTDLFTVIERSGAMANFGEWVLRAMRSTCAALQRLHGAGLVYCDLKPENVLVRLSDAQARFGDFDRSCVPGLKLGVVGGTKGYYSPERMRNSSLHTVADDVWAFGVLMLIGSTTAASPYLDYTPETVHKFVPSKYLKRYSRCGWSQAVTNKVGYLCDRLLDVDKDSRAPLSLAVEVLSDIVAEMDGRAAQPAPQHAELLAHPHAIPELPVPPNEYEHHLYNHHHHHLGQHREPQEQTPPCGLHAHAQQHPLLHQPLLAHHYPLASIESVAEQKSDDGFASTCSSPYSYSRPPQPLVKLAGSSYAQPLVLESSEPHSHSGHSEEEEDEAKEGYEELADFSAAPQQLAHHDHHAHHTALPPQAPPTIQTAWDSATQPWPIQQQPSSASSMSYSSAATLALYSPQSAASPSHAFFNGAPSPSHAYDVTPAFSPANCVAGPRPAAAHALKRPRAEDGLDDLGVGHVKHAVLAPW